MIRPGINLRFGGGLANYNGSVNWEYPFSDTQKWKGSSIGFHGAFGGELMLNKNTSVSLIFLGRFAKISELKDNFNNVIKKPDGSNDNLQLNLSGLEIRILFGYFL